MSASGTGDFATRLERLRERLLDLTARNKLLNFTHRSGAIRIVDEIPDQLFQRLTDGKSFAFEPVPEPTERELERWKAGLPPLERDAAPFPTAVQWAYFLGRETSYDLTPAGDAPEERHQDDRLQTLLFRKQLDAALTKLRRDARLAVEELGTNLLHLALGFLQWRDRDERKDFFAPLILIPVEISSETTGGRVVMRLSWTGEDIQPNLSLEKRLRESFGLELPVQGDDERPEAFFRRVRAMIPSEFDWKVRPFGTLSLFQFGNLVLYRDLDGASWVAGRAPADHPLVQSVAFGARGDGGGSGEAAGPTPEAIDLELPLIDRADSSQARALARALSERSLVIQGPPGTGKSQTITNLIAAALHRGETVLFVAEKLAALEVVQKRLHDAGLGDFVLELHSHKTRKQALLEEIKRRLERTYPSVTRFADEEKKLAEARATLEAHVAAISETVGALGWPVSRVLFEAGGARLRRLEAGVRPLPADPAPFLAMTELDYDRSLVKLAEFEGRLAKVAPFGPLRQHPWAGVSSERIIGAIDKDEVVGLATAWREALAALSDALARAASAVAVRTAPSFALAEAFAQLDAARDEAVAIRRDHDEAVRQRGAILGALGLSRTSEAGDMKRAAEVASHLEELPQNRSGFALPEFDRDGAAAALVRAREVLDGLQRERAALAGEVDLPRSETVGAPDLREAAATIASSGIFRLFSSPYRAAKTLAASVLRRPFDRRTAPGLLGRTAEHLDAVAEFLRTAGTIAGSDLSATAARLDEAQELEAFVHRTRRRFGPLGGTAGIASAILGLRWTDLAELARFGREAAALRRLAAAIPADAPADGSALHAVLSARIGPDLAEALATADDRALETILAAAADVAAAYRAAGQAAAAFARRTGLGENGGPLAAKDLAALEDALEDAIRHHAELVPWVELDRFLRGSLPPAVRVVVDAVADGRVRPGASKVVFEDLLFDTLAREAHARLPALHRSANLDEARNAYREADERVMELRSAHIAATLARRRPPEGSTGRTVADLTELQLLRRELQKKTRHIPIRQLVRRAGAALQTLKPCFMMGPLSVAQYLPPNGITFDLVIFDEASQLKPEQALGALARGRRAVVVGDTNQLPPTDFFNRIGADHDDAGEEDDDIAETSSILESAATTSPSEMLRWHYRSRDPRLIQFSNERFYDGRLVLFPAAHAGSEDLGIRFRYLPDATYKASRNEAEARAIAAAVVEHFRSRPEESLGVVAMNVAQRDLIDAHIDALLAGDPALRERREDLSREAEPFFVKNLENVQGDERDVIMISMTYGPDPASRRVLQRFGPINSDLGWRRLNVLFSRAKKRMEIFSSMRAEHITSEATSRRGPRELRAFLHFAETGALEGPFDAVGTGKPPESEFEESVIAGLRRAGFVCRPQIGVKGFFVDIGIVDPDVPHEFALGIECDGAMYHSTRSARDRDRLRQDILEAMGWTIERVWSTDWFRDPEGELDRLVGVVNEHIEVRRARRRRAERESQPALTLLPSPGSAGGETGDEPITGRPSAPRGGRDPSAVPLIQLQPVASAAAGEVVEIAEPPAPAPDASGTEPISLETARSLLIALRERIAEQHPDIPAHANILRKSMMTQLLRHRPVDREEFNRKIPQSLRTDTLPPQLSLYGDEIFAILERVRG